MKNGLPILLKILYPFLGILILIILIFGYTYYSFNKMVVTSAVNESMSTGLKDALNYFNADYADSLKANLNFLQISEPLNNMISAPKTEAPIHRAEVEKQFINMSAINEKILSIRFVDLSGLEQVITSSKRRVTDYRLLENLPRGDTGYSRIARLFNRLRNTAPGTIYFEGPFKDLGTGPTFLAGICKNDPEIGGADGVIIVQYNLAEFINYLSQARILGSPAVWVVSLPDNVLLSPLQQDMSPNPLLYVSSTKQDGTPFISSVECRLGSDNAPLMKVIYSLSPKIFSSVLTPLVFRTLAIFLTMLVIMSLAAFIIARNISRPVIDMEKSVISIGKGDFTRKVTVSAGGEIQVLAEGINKMMENLAESQKRVIQSSKMAAVGQLASGVAHEINNPLGVILGFAQAAATKIDEANVLYIPVKSIEREALRCKNLVQELLNFSRVGKVVKEMCSLNDVINSSLTLVETRAKVNSVELFTELKDGLAPVNINHNQIQQVIINLSNNAVDAMASGGKLTVRSYDTVRDIRKYAVIEIADTGTGIPVEIQGKIFEPFFTTKEMGKGTGLGLALVNEIINKHGGDIELQSEPAKGTTFKVLLPYES